MNVLTRNGTRHLGLPNEPLPLSASGYVVESGEAAAGQVRVPTEPGRSGDGATTTAEARPLIRALDPVRVLDLVEARPVRPVLPLQTRSAWFARAATAMPPLAQLPPASASVTRPAPAHRSVLFVPFFPFVLAAPATPFWFQR